MKCRLVKLPQLSGNKTTVYSVIFEDDRKTLFDNFIIENSISFKSEIEEMIIRLNTIGNKTGARDSFFRHNEGLPRDGVCALIYKERKGKENLRLYCIRYGTQIIILGGGGQKKVKTLQDDEKLTKENYFLRRLSALISERIKEKDIGYSEDFMEFMGDLNFEDYE